MSKKPMSKRQRDSHVKKMRSNQMKKINAIRRSKKSFRETEKGAKTILADAATRGLYSKSRVGMHFYSGIQQRLEAHRTGKIAKSEAKILRKDRKRRT